MGVNCLLLWHLNYALFEVSIEGTNQNSTENIQSKYY